MMDIAAEVLRDTPEAPPPALRVDSALIASIEKPLRECLCKTVGGGVSREDIVDCIVRTEYSEWNDL
jgi:hypothetical protein